MVVSTEKKRQAYDLFQLSCDLTAGAISVSAAAGTYSPEKVIEAAALSTSFMRSTSILENLNELAMNHTIFLSKPEVDKLSMLCERFSKMQTTGWTPPTMPEEIGKEEPDIEFPKSVFSDDTERYITSIAESQQVDRAAVAVAVLAVMATAAQGKFVVKYPDRSHHKEPLNLYCLICANPSERKSTAYKHIAKPLFEWVEGQKECYKASMTECEAAAKASKAEAAALEKALKSTQLDDETRKELTDKLKSAEQRKAEVKAPVSPYCIFGDITPESLAKELQSTNEQGAIFNDESTTLRIMSGLYNNGRSVNNEIYLKAYDGGWVDVRRMSGNPIHLHQPLLSMLIYGQPAVIDQILTNEELIGNGMISRFCISYPKSMVEDRTAFVESEPNQSAFESYKATILDYMDIPRQEIPKTLCFSSEAIDFLKSDGYLQYLTDLPKKHGALHDNGEEAGKLAGHFIRICGLLHLLEHPAISKAIGTEAPLPEISKETTIRAIHISKFFVDSLIWFVRKSSQKESNNLEKVYQAVLAQTIYKGKSFTDIRSIQVSVRKTRELATVKAVKEILFQLQDMGLIDIDDQCSGTRRKLIFVNPLAVKKESERWKSLE